MMRMLSEDFLTDLKNGLLQPILERVRQDNTLMLAIRDGYINIYYRGGNILRLREQSKGQYKPAFDSQYNIFGKTIPNLPADIKDPNDVRIWLESFPRLKEIMDFYFSKCPKPEREFQQLVARENNDSTISNESEYFISDIEFADSELGARFDILAIRWLATQRKKGSKCKPAFIEMKYADGALGGAAGLLKHLKDFDAFIADAGRYKAMLLTMESQFSQLDQLGLMKFNRGKSNTTVALNPSEKPEVIFILANHNPRSNKLNTILSAHQFDEYDKLQNYDLRFYVASFAGYGLHADCMFTVSQFRKLLKSKNAEQGAALDGYSAALHSHQ
ncbi:MAG: hypothetical protein PHV28_08335 [Kiritimatiellae bacterium]|nr:hypothetical protein [Kiritimatiellia bacterium]